MRRLAAIIAAAATLGSGFGQGDAQAAGFELKPFLKAQITEARDKRRGMSRYAIRVGSLERKYSVYIPRSAPARAPLVVAFHGGNQDAARFAKGVDLQGMADRYGFAIALPEGVGRGRRGGSWNTDSIVRQGYAEEAGVDDLSFVSAMLNQLLSTGKFDNNRVYAMGVSKGGMMSYHAACNLPGRFEAIAVVAATLSSGRCANSNGVSLLHIHGTNDTRVPFDGGRGQNTARGANWASARDGITLFARAANCGGSWRSEQVTADTTCYSMGCPGSDEVEYCLVNGGGHTWPGVATTRRQKRQGAASSTSYNATDEIAQFFLSH